MLQLSDRQTGSFVIKLGPIVQHLYTYQRLVNQTALKAVKQACRVFGHISAEERLDSETCESRMSTEPIVWQDGSCWGEVFCERFTDIDGSVQIIESGFEW